MPKVGKNPSTLALVGALAVFLGGASYGVVGPVIKLASQSGFSFQQIMAAQSFGGLFIFAIVFGVSVLFGTRWQHMSKRDFAMLLLLGASTGCTNLCYNICLSHVSAALGVTLLFQYVWMGIVIQIIISRKPPVVMEIIAAIVVLGGTVGACGLLDGTMDFNLPGLIFGLGSALGYSLFLLISAHAGNDVPAMQRGLITCVGSCLVATLVCPTYLIGGVDLAAIAPYSLVMGCFALFLPVPLIGFGAKYISGGACNILASSELPSAFLIAFLLLGEPMGVPRVAGMVVILVGIALTQVRIGNSGGEEPSA